MRKFDGFRKTGIDSEVEDRLEAHCATHHIAPADAVLLFPVLARRQWLKRFLAHTEFFKMTLDIPGDIAELGVFRGLGLMTWANLLEAYCVGDRTKIVYGFDNWAGFKGLSTEDGKEEGSLEKKAGGFSPEAYFKELNDAIAIFDMDRFVPWKKRVQLIEGDLEHTAAKFMTDNPGVRFSLIHFDCDLYKPTKAALQAFWPVLSKGGVMLFDEYAIRDWPGETQAVDEYFAKIPGATIKTLPWTNAPAGYVVKS